MKIKQKIKEIEKELDINTHYPNYINKKIFWVGFILLLCIISFFVFSYGFNKKWYYEECTNIGGCGNHFINCKYKFYNTNCDWYLKNSCEGKNCDSEWIEHGDHIGEKPPFIVKNINLITIFLFLITGLINHLYYKLKVMKK